MAPTPLTRTRIVNLVGALIGVAGLAFVVRRVIRDRHDVADALTDATLAWLVPAFVGGLAAMTLIGATWLWLLRRSGARVTTRQAMAWFFVGQLGKYVPGGIWPVVGQAELAHRGDVPRGTAYASTATSMIGTFLGAGVVGATAGLTCPADGRLVPGLVAAGIVTGFAAFATPPIRRAVEHAITRTSRRTTALAEPGYLLHVVARHVPVWVLFSAMNLFSAVALGWDPDARGVVMMLAVTCLSWMAGFVIVGVPGGLGVRETVFISMMSAPLGAPSAVSVAVLSRVVSIVVDLAGAGAAVAFARRADPVGPSRQEPVAADRYAAR